MDSISHTQTQKCLFCDSTHTVRNGRSKGRQRLLCKSCHRTFYESPQPLISKRRLHGQYESFRTIANKSYPLRQVAQLIGVSVGTAFRWRHEYIATQKTVLPETTLFNSSGGAIQITSIYYGKASAQEPHSHSKRKSPRMARFSPIYADHYGTFTSVLHPVSSMPKTPALIMSAQPTKDNLADLLVEVSIAGACVHTPLGSGIVCKSTSSVQLGSAKVLWTPRKRWKLPLQPDWRIACAHIPPDPQRYMSKAIEARNSFLHFMRRFRGIAIKNVQKYISWYNSCLAST